MADEKWVEYARIFFGNNEDELETGTSIQCKWELFDIILFQTVARTKPSYKLIELI